MPGSDQGCVPVASFPSLLLRSNSALTASSKSCTNLCSGRPANCWSICSQLLFKAFHASSSCCRIPQKRLWMPQACCQIVKYCVLKSTYSPFCSICSPDKKEMLVSVYQAYSLLLHVSERVWLNEWVRVKPLIYVGSAYSACAWVSNIIYSLLTHLDE